MPLSSMTGFARSQGQIDDRAWTWEVRSVNGRGLDIRLRYPPGFDALDLTIRERIGKRFRRGNVSATLNVQRTGGTAAVRINGEVLDHLLSVLPDVQRRLPDCAAPSPEGVLGLRGVIETTEEDLDDERRSALQNNIIAGLETALSDLAAMRREEGARIATVLAEQLTVLETHVHAARNAAASQPDAILARLIDQIAALTQAIPALPEERIVQEAALLATRADAREELDRLLAHLDAARELLGGGKPAGRRLDFLCQELNREANTLCSKAQDVSLTRIGLDLKATIEQFREQVQNIE